MDLTGIFGYAFIRHAFIAGALISVLCAVLGVILVLRRLSLIGDGLAHVTFGSAALAMALNLYPLAVSLPLVVVSSFGILKITERTRVYGDAAIGVVSSIGIAFGVLFASIAGGFNVDLFSYLFGSILSIRTSEVFISAAVCLVSLAVIYLHFDEIYSITFDEEFARASGIRVDRINAMLMVLTAVTVVLAMKIVGVMLTSALLVLPAVTALQNSHGFRNVIISAAAVSVVCLFAGVLISFSWDIPSGAAIVIVNALFCAAAFVYRSTAGRS